MQCKYVVWTQKVDSKLHIDTQKYTVTHYLIARRRSCDKQRISRVFKYKYLNVLYTHTHTHAINIYLHMNLNRHIQEASKRYSKIWFTWHDSNEHIQTVVPLGDFATCLFAEILHTYQNIFLHFVAAHVSVAEAVVPTQMNVNGLPQLCNVSLNKWRYVSVCACVFVRQFVVGMGPSWTKAMNKINETEPNRAKNRATHSSFLILHPYLLL